MKKYSVLALSATLIALLGPGLGRAQAQARTALATASSEALTPVSAPARRADDPPDESRDPMASAGIGVKLGFAGIVASRLQVEREGRRYVSDVDARTGLHLALPIHLGGEGFGWTIEPYLSRSRIGRAVKDATGMANGSEDVELTALGAYTGPVVNLHLAEPFYLGVGFGARAAYVASDAFALGVDIYGRAPISATYYLAPQFALVAEVGLGYGGSIFAHKSRVVVDPTTNRSKSVTDDPLFGRALSWDFSVGVRLP